MEIEFDNEKYNTISINLFKLLKNHEYDKFKKVIIENKNILENIINIRDETNTYLLIYAILYNQFDIIRNAYRGGNGTQALSELVDECKPSLKAYGFVK